MGKALGVDEKWVYNIVKQVGNYGESFERNVGKIERGLNALWSKGGLLKIEARGWLQVNSDTCGGGINAWAALGSTSRTLLNTLKVAILGIILATVLGTLLGVGRLSPNWLLSKLCEYYVEIFRNVPLLLWLFLIYKMISEAFPGPRQAINVLNSFFLSNRGLYFPVPLADPIHEWMGVGLIVGIVATYFMVRWARRRQEATGQPFHTIYTGIGLVVGIPLLIWIADGAPRGVSWPELKGFNFVGGTVIQPEFTALLVGLVLYTSAFVAEIVRSGILALNKGQSEAAAAIGLSRGQVMRLVLLPQAMRIIVPPMTSQYLNITKNSSLAIAIGYPDLVASVNVTINQTGQAIENVLIIMAVYLTVSLSISAFMNWYNKRIALTER
jgi:general L-amino acid transport system permease protein